MAACLEHGTDGPIGKNALLDEMIVRVDDVVEGTSLICFAAGATMIDELRMELDGRRRALSPFERSPAREREGFACRARRRFVR